MVRQALVVFVIISSTIMGCGEEKSHSSTSSFQGTRNEIDTYTAEVVLENVPYLPPAIPITINGTAKNGNKLVVKHGKLAIAEIFVSYSKRLAPKDGGGNEPQNTFGASVYPLSFWSGNQYYQGGKISSMTATITPSAVTIDTIGTIGDGSATVDVTEHMNVATVYAASNYTSLTADISYTARTPIPIDSARIAQGEGWKYFVIATMYRDEQVHDSDRFEFREEMGSETYPISNITGFIAHSLLWLYEQGPNRGATIVCRNGDASNWWKTLFGFHQSPPPDLQVSVSPLPYASAVANSIPRQFNSFSQGWTQYTTTTDSDNVGAWVSNQSIATMTNGTYKLEILSSPPTSPQPNRDGKIWKLKASPVRVHLKTLWGFSPSDIWAVGDAGTLIHYDGTQWTQMASPTTVNLHAIGGISATDVWAVGWDRQTYANVVLHYDGTQWVHATTPQLIQVGGGGITSSYSPLRWRYVGTWGWVAAGGLVWGATTNDIWSLGVYGYIGHYDGTQWTAATSPTAQSLHDIWGSSATDIWVVGEDNHMVAQGYTILHYDGNAWMKVPHGWYPRYLNAVWGSDADNVWAVGGNGYIFRRDKKSDNWSIEGHQIDADLFDIWGTSPTDVWIVGENGIILHLE